MPAPGAGPSVEGPADFHEDRLARQARAGLGERGETDVTGIGPPPLHPPGEPVVHGLEVACLRDPHRRHPNYRRAMTTVAELLVARAEDDHTGLRFEDASWSWRQVVAASLARARMLRDLRQDGPFHVGRAPRERARVPLSPRRGRAGRRHRRGDQPHPAGGGAGADVAHADCQLIVTDATQRALLDGLDTGVELARILSCDAPDYPPRRRASGPDHDGQAIGARGVARRRRSRSGHAVPAPVHVGLDGRPQGGAGHPGADGGPGERHGGRVGVRARRRHVLRHAHVPRQRPQHLRGARHRRRCGAGAAPTVLGVGVPPRRPEVRRDLFQLRRAGARLRARHPTGSRRRRQHPALRLRHGRLSPGHLDVQAPLRMSDRRGLRIERGRHLHVTGTGHAPPGHGEAAPRDRCGDRRRRRRGVPTGGVRCRGKVGQRVDGHRGDREPRRRVALRGLLRQRRGGRRAHPPGMVLVGRPRLPRRRGILLLRRAHGEDWLRVDGENFAAAPVERILAASPAWSQPWCSPCPTRGPATRSWPPSS